MEGGSLASAREMRAATLALSSGSTASSSSAAEHSSGGGASTAPSAPNAAEVAPSQGSSPTVEVDAVYVEAAEGAAEGSAEAESDEAPSEDAAASASVA